MVRKTQKINPLVSVNIRTYNSSRTIEKTLLSVSKQSYKNIEVVVSDGHSKDGTVDILKKYKVRIFYEDKLGDARKRNIKESRGKYILSLDSDQIMEKNLIKECVLKCENQGFGSLIISEKSKIEKGTYLERLIAYDKTVIDKGRDIHNIYGTACPRFFKKSDLEKIKWPKKISIFDDAILYSCLIINGVKVGYLKSSSIIHREVKEWRVLFKKFFRYGQGYVRALRVSPATVSMHSLPRKSYFSKAALKKPKYFFGLFLLYAFKVFSASLGALFFIFKKLLNLEK